MEDFIFSLTIEEVNIIAKAHELDEDWDLWEDIFTKKYAEQQKKKAEQPKGMKVSGEEEA